MNGRLKFARFVCLFCLGIVRIGVFRMPLVFRPTHHSPEEDYDIVCGGLVIGTILKEKVGRREEWRWYVHGITAPPVGHVRLSGYEPDFERAKSAVAENWGKWLALAKLKEWD